MDHPHNHYSWRPPPPQPIIPQQQQQGNNICPICSFAHFPFCPPNPRFFPSHNTPNYPPQFDHPPYYNHNHHPIAPFRDPLPRQITPNLVNYDHGVKRMRDDVDNAGSYSSFVSEDERRLKLLIRDHGSVGNGGTNGYVYDKPGLGRNCGNEVTRKLDSNAEMYEFQNPCVDGFERGSVIEPGVGPRGSSEDKGFGYGQRYMNDVENVDRMRFSDDVRRQSVVPQSVQGSYAGSPNEIGLNYNSQWVNSSDSMSMKEPYYSRVGREMQGSVNEPRSNFPLVNQEFDNQLSNSYRLTHHSEHQNPGIRPSFGVSSQSERNMSSPSGHHNLQKGVYPPIFNGATAGVAPRVYDIHPPLPASPPPPLPMEPRGNPYPRPFASSSPPVASNSLFPISVSSSIDVSLSHSSLAEVHSSAQKYHSDKPNQHILAGAPTEDIEAHQASLKKYSVDYHTFPLRSIVSDNPKAIDASQILKQPHRATRPDHIVIILRGLPGSGKSYLAKILRDLEVENGGDAPRIHSMDDYFMTEVEKVVDSEFSKSPGSIRGRKPVTKKVMEYCYEPEMEEAYRSSMLKAFKKTLDDGVFSFIIVDDRNLRVADFAQFWATAKRLGFEVYLLEATYKDPAGCAARNVHGFTQDDIQKMACQWEEASSLYLKLDAKSLLGGAGLEDGGIQEVDMDMEDEDPAGGLTGSEDGKFQDPSVPHVNDLKSSGSLEHDNKWSMEDNLAEEVKELRTSKWSNVFDEGDGQRSESSKSTSSALSGLISAYGKKGKSVSWGDKVGSMGFSIGAANKAKLLSLVIGPGAGYNLKSNPLTEKDNLPLAKKKLESRRQNVFQEQLRAERESFKAIFEKRKQRIGGLGTEDDSL
ncbi:YLP motif-containing protein 1 [Heracleum sosnowskyi]|uniref:YLP motif-containing protein 1 n=1 Tax=Heracleum sosnowskyi TaxID=360622 RepID=A0AAD8H2H3_9APIA|nr:YLP motif-containing protein 1 [Heracleum sosnowskyi]